MPYRVTGDVSAKDKVAEMVEAIGKHTQVVDVLINCAGLLKPWRKMCDVDDGESIRKPG
jgi:NAD(P)-dependent dehydrogenase (short-subunit alcohol dehydrogenase family)